ncbi:gag-pol polyprotein [Cucumis melo var. makuwa]|uniref:Gag-pol polyprotein n=1 Tax=Cucumis melo var. makuwa TaxID=1194695 RepID=A0A5D3DQV7_CUCMM|nr:gag-pol polyprotein [Cucumis melo var. makuwa]TYK26033.1 gag-pol polyprotein [Cucumis melo var. makuwa]
MKVTAIEEVQDLTTLKLDELFGSLLTFEMAMSNRESKKVKRIAFKLACEQDTIVNQSDNEVNQDESIALLTKKFSKMARKFKSMNTAGRTVKTGRHDGENSARKGNDFSYRRNSDHDDDEVDDSMNAFTACITEINSKVESECSGNDEDEEVTLEKLKMLRKEDSEARAIQKERIQDLMEENEGLMGVVSSLKVKSKEVQHEYDQIIKSVKMQNSGTDSLDSILNSGQNGLNKYGLGFDASTKSVKITPKVRFVPASVKETTEPNWENMLAKKGVQTHVDVWYFDSGCSRHMTGNRSFFTELEECVSDHVTFGDGAKGKSDTGKLCINLCLNLQREKGQKIIRIRSDHGKEFDNEDLNNFCQSEGIHHEFVVLITPQQNGVVERKNKTLQEMAQDMIHAKSLPFNFCAEAVNTTCHIHNTVTTRSSTTVTLYELWKGRKPNVKYFHIFGSTCYILVDREYHRKWDVKSDQGVFLGYSQNSRAYRVFNIKSETVMETINVVVNDFEFNVNQFNSEDDETSVTPHVTSTPLMLF